jgi:hypothetical protein
MSTSNERLAELVNIAGATSGDSEARVTAIRAAITPDETTTLLASLREAVDAIGDDDLDEDGVTRLEHYADVHAALTAPAAAVVDIHVPDITVPSACCGNSGSQDTNTTTTSDEESREPELVTARNTPATGFQGTAGGGTMTLFRARAADTNEQVASQSTLAATVKNKMDVLARSGSFGQTAPLLTFSDPAGPSFANAVNEESIYEHMETLARTAVEHERHRMARTALQAKADNALEFSVPDPNKPYMGSCCAEPVPLYEFCQTPPLTGILDLPSITVPCGGLKLPNEPTVTLDLGCWQTADKDGDPGARQKPCATIGCVDWRTIEPCLTPLCIEVDIMMRRGFPALVTKAIAEALRLYEKFHNRETIKAIRAVAQKADFSVIATEKGLWGTANLVARSAIMIASQIRAKRGLPVNSPIRLVAPFFARDSILVDLMLRQQRTTLAMWEADLATAGISVTWVNDMEGFDGVDTSSGWGAAPPYKTAWPAKFWYLLFPPDAFYLARDEIVRVSGLRQSPDLLRENKELALFVEHSRAVVDRCPEAVEVTINNCPTGFTTSGQIVLDEACGPVVTPVAP